MPKPLGARLSATSMRLGSGFLAAKFHRTPRSLPHSLDQYRFDDGLRDVRGACPDWAQGRSPRGIHGTPWASSRNRSYGLLPRKDKAGQGVCWRLAPQDRPALLPQARRPEHVVAIAPTRSGKGVGLVVPMLLSWPHSCVVNDQGGELWNSRRPGAKGRGQCCAEVRSGATSGSVSFNPLEEIRLGTIHEVGDVQDAVTILVDPKAAAWWITGPKPAMPSDGGGADVLYKKKAEGKVGCVPDVANALSDPDKQIDDFYVEMIADGWGERGEPNHTIALGGRDMLNRPDRAGLGAIDRHVVSLALPRSADRQERRRSDSRCRI